MPVKHKYTFLMCISDMCNPSLFYLDSAGSPLRVQHKREKQ